MSVMELSDTDFYTFRNLINDHSGIYLSDQKMNFLKIRLIHRMEACKVRTIKEYYYYLKYDPRSDEEIQNLIDAVTINETHFFRGKAQFNAFNHMVLNDLIGRGRSSGEQRLRLWSAACSTGEEAYSMAMSVTEALKESRMWNVEIAATDISNAALASARRGVYEDYSLRDTELRFINKYFQHERDTYRVNERIRSLIRFGRVNLIDSAATKKMVDYDCIFCRNVIMYFDMDMRQRVIENLYRSLRPGGWLLLGEAESLAGLPVFFNVRHFEGVILYQRPETEDVLKETGE